jgi:hypothetical protein
VRESWLGIRRWGTPQEVAAEMFSGHDARVSRDDGSISCITVLRNLHRCAGFSRQYWQNT